MIEKTESDLLLCSSEPPKDDKAERRKKADAIILEAARKELMWDTHDERHNPVTWKDKVRRQLLQELGIESETYT